MKIGPKGRVLAETLAVLVWLAILSGCASEPQEDEAQATASADCPPYDRDDYKAWIDADGDCQDTRAEVLIAESRAPVGFTNATGCTVATGQWYDPYTATAFTSASDLDIDHLVPLKEAHDSGAFAWDAATKQGYANDLSDPDTLIAVSASANRSKGDRDVAEWLPPNPTYVPDYARAWSEVKRRWGLTANTAEIEALTSLLGAGADLPQQANETTCTGSSGATAL